MTIRERVDALIVECFKKHITPAEIWIGPGERNQLQNEVNEFPWTGRDIIEVQDGNLSFNHSALEGGLVVRLMKNNGLRVGATVTDSPPT